MRWFKHYTDTHRGRSFEALFQKFEHFGPFAYFVIVEMCAEKLDKKKGESVDIGDCVFGFSQREVRQQCRSTPTRVRQLLEYCRTLELLDCEFSETEVLIKMPKLLECLDSDVKKTRIKRESFATQTPLEVEEEKKKIKKEKKITNSSNSTKANAFIAAYCERFKSRWGSNPPITKKDSGIAKRVSEQFSEEKLGLYLDAYFSMPDSWVLKTKHPIATFELKLNEIVVFATSGNFTTNRDARMSDDMAASSAQLARIRSGELGGGV